jgi:hypothetical protein
MFRLVRSRHPKAWLAVYAVCVVFICSFVLFEVLDVDGSDFPPPTRSLAPINALEAPHDMKRLPFQSPRAALASAVERVDMVAGAFQGAGVAPSQSPPPRTARVRLCLTVLARASLPPPPPAA